MCKSEIKLINTKLRTVSLNPPFPYFCILLAFDQVVMMHFAPMFCISRFSIEHFALKLSCYSSTRDGVMKKPRKLILLLFFA